MVSEDISGFVLTNRLGTSAMNWKFYGRVIVTHTVSKFWWRQDEVMEEHRNIYKKYGDGWCYVDDGVYLPADTIGELVRAWEAQNKTTIEEAEL